MATLYLHCAICGRKQADGLLSGAAWGSTTLPTGAKTEHPAVRGSVVRACPTCVGRDEDWPTTARAAVGSA
ncbi:MAG: hypothetical protein H0U08_02480 [Actinobacteria bacterium]|nr:hypothetical protein [Actinomycetota bacterium]